MITVSSVAHKANQIYRSLKFTANAVFFINIFDYGVSLILGITNVECIHSVVQWAIE